MRMSCPDVDEMQCLLLSKKEFTRDANVHVPVRIFCMHKSLYEVKVMETLWGWPENEWRILRMKHEDRNWHSLPSQVLNNPEAQKPNKNETWLVLIDPRVRAAFENIGLKYPALDDLYTQIEIEFSRPKTRSK